MIKINSNRYSITQVFILLLIGIIFIRDISLFINQEKIASILFIAIFCVLGLLLYFKFISIISKKMTNNEWLIFFIGCVTLIIICILSISNVGFNLIDNAKSTVGILLLITFLICEPSIKMDSRIINFYLNFNVFLSVVLCIFALFPSSYNFTKLVFNFSNSNQTGLFLFLTFGYSFIYFIKEPKNARKKRIFLFTLLLLQFLLCVLTQSRTSILGCLSVVLIYSISKKKFVWLKRCTWLFILMPIVIPIIWISLYNSLDTNFMILGKTFFSGREVIWDNIFTIVWQNPFANHIMLNGMSFGDGLDVHNAFLNIMWNYSLPVMVLVYTLFVLKVCDCLIRVESRVGISMMGVLLSVFFHMAYEQALLSAGINYMLKAFFVILMIRGIENENKPIIFDIARPKTNTTGFRPSTTGNNFDNLLNIER